VNESFLSLRKQQYARCCCKKYKNLPFLYMVLETKNQFQKVLMYRLYNTMYEYKKLKGYVYVNRNERFLSICRGLSKSGWIKSRFS